MLDLGEFQSLDATNLLTAVYLSPVTDPTTIKLWLFTVCSIWSQTSSDFQLCLLETELS